MVFSNDRIPIPTTHPLFIPLSLLKTIKDKLPSDEFEKGSKDAIDEAIEKHLKSMEFWQSE